MSKSKQNIRTFYTIILTQTFSLLGTQISGLAVGIWLYDRTGQAMPLALVAFFGILPKALAAGAAGVLADRWNRRYVMALADAGQAVGSLLLLLSIVSSYFELWHLYTITLLQAVFRTFQEPAFEASVTLLVPDSERDRANAIRQVNGSLSGIISPSLAAVTYALVGVTGAIGVDLLTFLVAVGVLLNAHIPQPEQTEIGKRLQGSIRKDFLVGWKYLREARPIFLIFAMSTLTNFFATCAVVLFTPYILARTHENEFMLGILLGVADVGAVIGGIVIGVWGGTRPRKNTFIPAFLISAVFLALIGVARQPILMGMMFFLFNLPLAIGNAPLVSIFQVKIPPDIQGRVFGVLGQINIFLNPVGFLLGGALADHVFEPAVGAAGWDVVAPLVGNGVGAGMGLLIFICGALELLTLAVGVSISDIRNIETALPDYAPWAARTDEPDIAGEPELTPIA